MFSSGLFVELKDYQDHRIERGCGCFVPCVFYLDEERASKPCGFASGGASRYSPCGMRKQQQTTTELELALLCICFPSTTESSATGTGSGCVSVPFGITHGSDLRFIAVIIEAEC